MLPRIPRRLPVGYDGYGFPPISLDWGHGPNRRRPIIPFPRARLSSTAALDSKSADREAAKKRGPEYLGRCP